MGEHRDQAWDVFLSVHVQSESKCVIRFFCGLPTIWAKLLCTKTNHTGFQFPPKSEKGETELVQLWQQPYCQRTRVSNLEIPRRLGNKEAWLSERGEEVGAGRSF